MVSVSSPALVPQKRGLFPDIPPLDNTYGAILMASNFSLILYGFTLHQAMRYLRLYPNDTRFVKTLVWAVLLFETVNSAFCMHISYHHLVQNYFNPAALLVSSWSIDAMPIAAGISVITAQCFFVRRVFILGAHRWVAYIAVALLVAELAFCSAATAEAFIQPSYEAFRKVTWLISAAFGIIVLTDTMLTTSLIIALRKSRTGYNRTDSIIEILVLYAITTGLVTTIINLVAFFFALILPDNLIYVGVNIVAGKLYVVSLFAALNFRKGLATSAATVTIYGTGEAAGNSVTVSQGQWGVAPRDTSSSMINIHDFRSTKSGGLAELGLGERDPSARDIFEMRPVAPPTAR